MKKIVLIDEVSHQPFDVFYAVTSEGLWVHFRGETSFHKNKPSENLKSHQGELISKNISGDVRSPLPGRILDIKVKLHDKVKKDEVLMILEAMKMEYEIRAPKEGLVSEILVKKEAQVIQNCLLVQIK